MSAIPHVAGCICGWCAPPITPTFTRKIMDGAASIREDAQDTVHDGMMGTAYARSMEIYKSVLPEAQKLVHGDRQAYYGHPLDNFTITAGLWEVYLKGRHPGPLLPEDVAIMKILMKVAREMHKHNRDNPRDIAGYGDNLEMIHHERNRRGNATQE